jgi:hypothetical protein
MQVLVVPNEDAVKKIPSAPGLLLYRPNKETLSVRGAKDWKKIAMHNEVNQYVHHTTVIYCGAFMINAWRQFPHFKMQQKVKGGLNLNWSILICTE